MTSLTLLITDTPTGVLIRLADGSLPGDSPAARVAATLCRFADGLFENGEPVRLSSEIVEAVL